MRSFLFVTLIFVVLLTGCTAPDDNNIVSDCIRLYQQQTIDLSNGPCFANPLERYQDWVCDVAHNPRTDADNLAENQCADYGSKANHFVEVDASCNFIRKV